jgi:hypothetical protein
VASAADGTARYVVRPYRGYGLFVAGLVAVIAAIELTTALRRGSVVPVAAAAVLLGLAVVLAAEALVARVTWDGAVLRRYDLGRSRAVSRADLGSALLLPSYRRTRRREPAPLLVFLDPGGRVLLRLGGGMWQDEEVVGLAEAVAGDAVERVDGTTDVTELERRHPGALTAAERHRTAVSALRVLAIAAIVGLNLRNLLR